MLISFAIKRWKIISKQHLFSITEANNLNNLTCFILLEFDVTSPHRIHQIKQLLWNGVLLRIICNRGTCNTYPGVLCCRAVEDRQSLIYTRGTDLIYLPKNLLGYLKIKIISIQNPPYWESKPKIRDRKSVKLKSLCSCMPSLIWK